MQVLLIMLILILGYRYTNFDPSVKVNLKQSNSWESYVILGWHGLRFVVKGIITYISLWLRLFCIALPFYFLGSIDWLLCLFKLFNKNILDIPIHEIAIFFLSFLCCEYNEINRKRMCKKYTLLKLSYIEFKSKFYRDINSKNSIKKFLLLGCYWGIVSLLFVVNFFNTFFIFKKIKNFLGKEPYKKSNKWLDDLAKENAILGLIITSAREQKLINVSVKSRKVYVGIIQSEQFDKTNVDSINLIPFFSGYRDQEKLKTFLDFNYVKLYEEKGLFDKESDLISSENLRRMGDYRVVIRMSEVESISFFE